jgi:hypothetical protein
MFRLQTSAISPYCLGKRRFFIKLCYDFLLKQSAGKKTCQIHNIGPQESGCAFAVTPIVTVEVFLTGAALPIVPSHAKDIQEQKPFFWV